MTKFECWQMPGHADIFDSKIYFPSSSLKRVYNNFNEFVLLNKFVPKDKDIKLLEVGCAAGELYRYFRSAYPNCEYVGSDVSKSAIEKAKIKYSKAIFIATDADLEQAKDISPDYIFSRDVVLHQEDPFGFLGLLCSLPRKGLILRLRTKDKGPTERNPEKSCQFYLGTWIPYMVLNCDEIVAFLKSLKRCSKIVFLKNYMPLGGMHNRYLPKDCYLKSTGTAETAMYIELNDNSSLCEVRADSRNDDYRVSIYNRLFYRAIKFLVRNNANSRIWW